MRQNKTVMQSIDLKASEEGLIGLQTNCYSCHNPNTESHDSMLAPPLAGIKYKYMSLYPEEEVFVKKMSEFVAMPSKENAVMKGPVKRFGLMPKPALAKEEILELVKYIYHNELEVPQWFSGHFEEQHGVKWENKN
jgi:cytochrome c551/c552